MSSEIDQLSAMRHSLAHVLAQAVLRLYPNTKISIGPPIDTGCYYDFLFEEPISADNFPKIEKEMRKILKEGQTFRRDELKASDAKEFWKERGQPFKVELIQDLQEKENVHSVTHYANVRPDGTMMFIDLCRGGHVEKLSEIPADGFKIMSLAGAYWRGDETREQLTRMYVAAFASKEELDAYLQQLEEAKKRDHRTLGKELEMFAFSEKVGPGLPLWLPKGAFVVEKLEELAKETEEQGGYQRVRTPHIAKASLYEQTGHLAHYKEDMFPPMQLDGEETEYYLKPMNCPHHHQLFASLPRSYKELPLRFAEYGHCYRYEDSGALFGLMRVRSLCMNDAHIYVTEEQFEEEFLAVMRMYLFYFELFGIEKYQMRLSLHESSKLGEKYVDNQELWLKTEQMVRDALKNANIPYVEVPDEAAFYGPKIDVQVWSAIGREFTLATNQVDFDVPGKVGLRYTDADGSEKTPLCIHRAPLSTHERMIGFLIEHFAGHFPLWMAPVHAVLLPVAGAHEEFCAQVGMKLMEAGIRAEIWSPEESLGKRIRKGELQRVPYLLVVGDQEIQSNAVTARNVKTKHQQAYPVDDFKDAVVQAIEERRLEHPL